jgi:hypothetical protein
MSGVWVRSRREYALTALFEGFFGAAWFGWGQAEPPATLSAILAAGSVVAILTAIAGGVLSYRFRSSSAAMDEQASRRRYGITVGIEFGLAGIGAAALGISGQSAYIPVWVCAVVGVHFFPLAPVLRDRTLFPLGALVSGAAAAALIVGLTTHVAPSAVTGVAAGWLLTLFALANLVSLTGPTTRKTHKTRETRNTRKTRKTRKTR